jgi:hypothetical protein
VIGVVVSGLGLFLGLTGLLIAILRRGTGVGFAIAGTAISFLAMMICLSWTLFLGGAVKAVNDVATQQRSQSARPNKSVPLRQPGPSDNPDQAKSHASDTAAKPSTTETQTTIVNDPATSEADSGNTGNVPASENSDVPATEIGDGWVDAATKAAVHEMISVSVSSVKIDYVTGSGIRDFSSEDKVLIITLKIENTNANQKVQYRGWGQSINMFDSSDVATLSDNFDNSYKRIKFGIGDRIHGQVLSESIYPMTSITDVLVFEVPVRSAEFLNLELPAKAYGKDGSLRLRIPISMLTATASNSTDTNTSIPEKNSEAPSTPPQQSTTDVAGKWVTTGEDGKTVKITITQKQNEFVARCTYRSKKHGEIRWRLNGTISPTGQISGQLVHTKAPKSWVDQTHTAQLSADGNTIEGNSILETGDIQKYVWSREAPASAP